MLIKFWISFGQCFQKGSLESITVSKMDCASNAGDHPDVSNLGNNMRHREVGNHLLLTLFETICGHCTGTGPGHIVLHMVIDEVEVLNFFFAGSAGWSFRFCLCTSMAVSHHFLFLMSHSAKQNRRTLVLQY